MPRIPIYNAHVESAGQKDLGISGKTIGQMLRLRAKATPDWIAYKSKKHGVWENTTWSEAYLRACRIGRGLLSKGIQMGDRIAILSGTKEDWTLCDQGILLAGAVTVPIYPSTLAEGCGYILNHSECSIAMVEDEKQLAKILQIRSQIPSLRKVVVIDAGAYVSDTDFVISLAALERLGDQHEARFPKALEEIEAMQEGQSIASITYTSGTTGRPKGAIITHEAFTVGVGYAISATPTEPSDTQLFFLPLSHSFAHMISIYAIRIGFCTAFAESLEKLGDNLGELKPTCMLAVPRIFEKIHQGFLQKARSGGSIKKSLVSWALSVGQKISRCSQAGNMPSSWLSLQYTVADRLVFQKLRSKMGGKLRWFISGSAPLSLEIIEFFHAAGMIVLEGYGLTETNSITTVNRMDRFKFGTVGQVHHKNLSLTIANDGEILTKGITNFKGYYKMPEATKEAIDEEGWFHTGDIGELDADGFLKITDRKKDLIKTSAGKFVAPQMLEGLLRLHPLVTQAIVIGDRHKYITALLAINLEACFLWLQKKSGTSIQKEQINTHPLLLAEMDKHLAQVNQKLGSWEQIKYFRFLPRELTEAEGEVTPSLKIKRKVVLERYKDLIDSMYVESEEIAHPLF